MGVGFRALFAEALAEAGRAFLLFVREPWVVFMTGGFLMLFTICVMTTL